MMPKLKVIVALSCWCLLALCFHTATQGADRPVAPESSQFGLSAHTGTERDRVKPEDDTEQGIKTIKGEVLRVKGQHFYVRQSDGKEIHLHVKPNTHMKRELKKGDRIEVKIDDQENALSIR